MKLLAALLCLSCSVGVANAATPAPQAPAQSTTSSARVALTGWKLECDPVKGSLACRAINQVLQPNGGLVIGFTLAAGTDGKIAMTVSTPLGVSVRTPIVVSVPGGPSQTFTFLTCSQQGCFAIAPVDTALLDAMRTSKNDLRVTYGVLDGNLAEHDVTATIPLGGFAEVADRLK